MPVKTILSRLRKVELINYPIRLFLKKGHTLFAKLIHHWPVSGTVKANFEGTKFKVYNQCDDSFVQYFYYNLDYHESAVLSLTNAFATRSRNIVDIGANTGIDAIIIAKKNPRVQIYALEPYEINYQRLEKNIALNGLNNIRIQKIALGEKEGEIGFHVPVNNRIIDVASAVKGVGEKVYGGDISWKTVPVRQITFDKLVEEIGVIDFFKCDVEGYEMNVFRGAESFFQEQKPSFIVEIFLSDASVTFFNEFAERHGYTVYYLTKEGLVKLSSISIIDWKGDFLFSRYNHAFNFIPNKDVDRFVESAWTFQ